MAAALATHEIAAPSCALCACGAGLEPSQLQADGHPPRAVPSAGDAGRIWEPDHSVWTEQAGAMKGPRGRLSF